jgi:UDP-N-acetylmuramoyl-tripeptide--D-alanyl-D-alanine ligase
MPFTDPSQVATWCQSEWEPCVPRALTGVSNNTRTLSPGNLYVAIQGERFDGHTFVDDAFVKGAAGALIATDSLIVGERDKPVLRVDNPVSGLGRLAAGYRESVNPTVVGITGSVGKSTVKEMTASILSVAMPTAKTRGNWNNDIGLPLSVLAMDSSARAGVFEVGMNHPGEIKTLCEILRPQWGIVTTIGPVHLEFFESIVAIAVEKAALLESLPDDGVAVLCCDDPYFEMLHKHVSCSLVTVSVGGSADYRVDYSPESETLDVVESATGEQLTMSWSWPGTHNALNAGYAVAVARGMQLEWDAITLGLQQYRPLSMRWEQSEAFGIQIINDAYNANPLSMRAAIATFSDLDVQGAKWLVLGDMLELGEHAESEHTALGTFVSEGSWAGVVVEGEFAECIKSGAIKGGMPSECLYRCGDNGEVVSLLKNQMVAGDAVFLKASRGVALEEVVKGLKKS